MPVEQKRAADPAQTAAAERGVARSEYERLGAVLCYINHQLRTPLDDIVGVSDTLLHTQLDASQRPQVEAIRSLARGLVEVIGGELRRRIETLLSPDARSANNARPAPALDWKRALDIAGGHESIAKEVASIFVQCIPERILDLRAMIGTQQLSEAQLQAHTLAGSAGTVGAEWMRLAAGEIERALLDDDLERAEALLRPLQRSYAAAEKALRALGAIEPEH